VKLRVIIRYSSGSKIYELSNQSHCIVGRKDSDMLLRDPRVSTHHAVIYEAFDGDLRIKDLNSRNGTLINGRRVTDASLHVEDEIRVGKTQLNILDYESTSQTDLPDRVKRLMESADKRPAKPDTQTSTHIKKVGVLHRWPDNIFSLPKERQDKFKKYVEKDGISKKTNIKKR